jgi:hypothetical protein
MESSLRNTNELSVCRIRNLLSLDWRTKPLVEDHGLVENPDTGVAFNAAATRDGRCFIAECEYLVDRKQRMLVKAYDGFNGRELWSVPSTTTAGGPGTVTSDATGGFVAFRTANTTNVELADVFTRKVTKTLAAVPSALGPKGDLYVTGDPGREQGFSLFSDTKRTPLVTLGIDTLTTSAVQFGILGSQLAWGNRDGSVTVCHLEEINRRLADANLQW